MFGTYDQIFNQRGEQYHRAMQLQPMARQKEFLLALQHTPLKTGATLCDLPSGGGYLVKHIPPELRLNFIAIDPSETFARTWRDDRFRCYLAPLNQVPLKDNAADALVSIAGLHHVENRPAVFKEMRRLLHPEGRLCILEVAVESITAMFLNGFVNRYNSMGHEGLFIDDSFRDDLVGAGFAITEDRAHRYSWDFSDNTKMALFLKLMFGLDKADAKTILDGVERILGLNSTAQGVSMGWELQCIVAR